jgi:hypothetical protein
MADNNYRISGVVLSRITKAPLPGLKVEAWDKDLFFDDLLGTAITDRNGLFVLYFKDDYFHELLERRPDVYFKIFYRGELIASTEDDVLWNLSGVDRTVEVIVDIESTHAQGKENFLVFGKVVSSDGSAEAGLTVKAFDKQLRYESLLGAQSTDNKGGYRIQYHLQQLGTGKSEPDLVVRVYETKDCIKPLAASTL